MNIIDIVILAILAASIIYGLYRGFVQTILSVACCLLSVLLAFTFGPRLAAAVSNSQGVTSTLATYTDAVTRVGDYELASTPVSGISDDLVTRVLSSVSLPAPIASILEGNMKGQVFSGTGLSTVNDYVSNTVVAVAINALSFIVCFAVSYLILSVIISLIQHVFRLPLLRQLDWLAGGIFGAIRGALIVYVLFLLVPIFSTVLPIDTFNELLAQSSLAPIFQSDGFFAGVISGRL